MIDANVAEIQHQLAVCMTWCGGRRDSFANDDLTNVFRSQSLAQFAASVFPDSCHTPFSPELISRFQRLADERARIAGPATTNSAPEFYRQQSLLVVNWQQSLFDGAVVPETRGVLDEDYLPAWDTWLSIVGIDAEYGTHGLLCWIPECLAESIDFAIRIDPACCMAWCDASSQMLQHRPWGKGIAEF